MKTDYRLQYQSSDGQSTAIPVNIGLPFRNIDFIAGSGQLDEGEIKRLVEIAGDQNDYLRAESLIDFLSISTDPGMVIMNILSMASRGESDWIKLLYSLFIAEVPPERTVKEYSRFRNLRCVIEGIKAKEQRGEDIPEREKLFMKRIELLPISHPLPGNTEEDSSAWSSWEKGVRRGLADPDERWTDAVRERILAELEAKLIRISWIIPRVDPDRHNSLLIGLANRTDDLHWVVKSLRISEDLAGGINIVIKKKLSEQWDYLKGSLEETEAGPLVIEMFENQEEKAHTYPALESGTAVTKAILEHPQLSTNSADIISCLYLFIKSAADNRMEFVFPSTRVDTALFSLQGFSTEENLLSVDLRRVSRGSFLESGGVPAEFDWGHAIEESASGDYKFLILSNLDNSTFLKHILDNPKLASKPGVVSLISLKCKSSEVLTKIASRRELYTGFANKEVPRNILMNPARVPITALRKFIHVRYVDKMTLMQMANKRGKGGQIREEVRREVRKYIDSF